ncbi:putative DUF21 domain-containing protein At3g13070, chloroplastic isoform X4 [Magnolia sinica]|uniref:putative DUF21 domain-containing protein At3g13070, chloroplastic isoform X4 n=1 Tax=Magnolia sinica TaxID=86752 RepID=UPI00265AD722|nr:putative DUF21 domain-containing protein At3g13070, chloroplastic isoform X4 [Magnolia sinica]
MGKIFEEKSGGFVTCESHSEEKRVDNIVGIAYAMDMLDYVEKVDKLESSTVGAIAHKPTYFVPGYGEACDSEIY